MNGWSTSREPEKPKTLTGKRALAVAAGEGQYVRLMQQATAAEQLYGRQAPVVEALYAGARTVRELLDLMPGAGAKV